MVGLVTQTLAAKIRRQLDARGLVIWFDPETEYTTVLPDLELGGATVERFDSSVFELRHRLEEHLGGVEPPRLLVYVPESEAKLGAALCELTAAGVVMRPGKQPPSLNTRLAVVARSALGQAMAESAVEAIVKQVEEGRLSLAELDALAERGREAHTGALAIIFGTANPAEVALRFLSDESLDGELARKGVEVGLSDLLNVSYGIELDPTRPLQELRKLLARFVLVSEILAQRTESELDDLLEVPHAPDEPMREKCVELVETWRNRRDLTDSYLQTAGRIERELGLGGSQPPMDLLLACETLRAFDDHLFLQLQRALIEAPEARTIDIAESRLAGFWATSTPDIMERWALLAAIGRVRVGAAGLAAQLRDLPTTPHEFVHHYCEGVEGEASWASLDANQRHMERRFHDYDLDHSGDTPTEQLIAKARDDYARTVDQVTQAFGATLVANGVRTPGVPRQLETFRRFVEPHLKDGRRVAFVLADGLRYEMAQELSAGLADDLKYELAFTLGTLPSITEVGMAALLPRADNDPQLVDAGAGKVALGLGDRVVRNRRERMAYLGAYLGDGFEELRLESILPPRGRTKAVLRDARFVCVTATDELDGLCEKGNVAMARRLMDDVLLQLRRGTRVLFDLGFDRVVITADHGFLFGEVLDEGSKIDPPGGKTADLHRRVWVGQGGAMSESTYRFKAADLGLGGELEVVVPKGIGAFKARGASTAYFHGGASLQELVVPVLTIEQGRPSDRPVGDVDWSVTLGSSVVSSLAVTATVSGEFQGLFDTVAPLVRIEIREGRKAISRTLAASYGLEETTGLVQLRPLRGPEGDVQGIEKNTVTLLLEPPKGDSVRLVVIDANTEKTLVRLDDIPVRLAGY